MSITRLSDEDVQILALESPTIAGHICKVAIVECSPAAKPFTVEALRRHIGERLGRAPRLAQKLARTPLGLANPVWVDDSEFDIANHVKRVDADGVLELERLWEVVAALMGQRLDRSQPLWRIDVVERLAGDRAALIWRVHHCLADGLTAFRLGSAALWETQADETEAGAPWHPQPAPGNPALLALAAQDRLWSLGRGLTAAAGALRSPRDIASSISRTARMPRAVLRELAPSSRPSPLDRHPTSARMVAVASASLEDIKRIEKSVGPGITVNDVVLSVVAGGLRRWLEHRGEETGNLRVKVPASLHHQDAAPDALGNHDSFMFVDLGIAAHDPVERLREISRETRARKLHRDPEEIYAFLRDLHHLSRSLERMASRWALSPRVFALNVSNCPGPKSPLFVVGHRISELYSFAEIADRHALRVAVVSVSGKVSFGICADAAIGAELQELATGIETELGALMAARG